MNSISLGIEEALPWEILDSTIMNVLLLDGLLCLVTIQIIDEMVMLFIHLIKQVVED